MNRFTKGLIATTFLAAATLLTGCATNIKASSNFNPPPAEAFSAFGRIEIKPAVFAPGVNGNAAALAKISGNIQNDMSALAGWNRRPSNGRTLVIEPVVEELSFKHGAKRVLLGPLAGSSGVLMRMNIKDNTGRVIASPEFFQQAGAMAAGWALGVHDNLMLTRVATLSTNYLKANFDKPVGGPTGSADAPAAP